MPSASLESRTISSVEGLLVIAWFPAMMSPYFPRRQCDLTPHTTGGETLSRCAISADEIPCLRRATMSWVTVEDAIVIGHLTLRFTCTGERYNAASATPQPRSPVSGASGCSVRPGATLATHPPAPPRYGPWRTAGPTARRLGAPHPACAPATARRRR